MARASQYDQHRELVLTHVWTSWERHSKPPSVRELADHASVSVSTMHSYLGKLAAEGMVEWRTKTHRSLHLTSAGTQLAMQLVEQRV